MTPRVLGLVALAIFFTSGAFAKEIERKNSPGTYEGITVNIKRAELSTNGKLVVVTAANVNQRGEGFVLVCEVAYSDCAFPKINRHYRVVSEAEGAKETWGLVSVQGKEKLSIFLLVFASAQ